MTDIATTLQRFNRKERYWVVRNALGGPARGLSPSFCARLQSVLGHRIERVDPETAWWAVDYHLDWLHAALTFHANRGQNPHGLHSNGEPGDPKTHPIKGQQEDIDLIFANGRDVILIEAKAFGAWNNRQFNSKLERLNLLPTRPDDIVSGDAPHGAEGVRLHFALMSPRPPRGLKATRAEPAWALSTDGEPYWLELQIDTPAPDLTVGRCGPALEGVADKPYWKLGRASWSAAGGLCRGI